MRFEAEIEKLRVALGGEDGVTHGFTGRLHWRMVGDAHGGEDCANLKTVTG
jgi:hypothetical protein